MNICVSPCHLSPRVTCSVVPFASPPIFVAQDSPDRRVVYRKRGHIVHQSSSRCPQSRRRRIFAEQMPLQNSWKIDEINRRLVDKSTLAFPL